jgi:hypothetical protein
VLSVSCWLCHFKKTRRNSRRGNKLGRNLNRCRRSLPSKWHNWQLCCVFSLTRTLTEIHRNTSCMQPELHCYFHIFRFWVLTVLHPIVYDDLYISLTSSSSSLTAYLNCNYCYEFSYSSPAIYVLSLFNLSHPRVLNCAGAEPYAVFEGSGMAPSCQCLRLIFYPPSHSWGMLVVMYVLYYVPSTNVSHDFLPFPCSGMT